MEKDPFALAEPLDFEKPAPRSTFGEKFLQVVTGDGILAKPLETLLEAGAMRLAGVQPVITAPAPTPGAAGYAQPAPGAPGASWIPGVPNAVAIGAGAAALLLVVLLAARRD